MNNIRDSDEGSVHGLDKTTVRKKGVQKEVPWRNNSIGCASSHLDVVGVGKMSAYIFKQYINVPSVKRC